MKKSLKIILTLVLVLASVFGLSKIRSAHADGSTGKIQITSKTITPAKSPVDQYTDIKVDLTFNVPNGVKSGDQAVITSDHLIWRVRTSIFVSLTRWLISSNIPTLWHRRDSVV